MSTLDKLSIRGVRSFDPKSTASVDFFSPVTLILGHNGAGKTTIIEALLYAIAGEMPPNTRRNAAFVHDPKLHGASTQALVALDFKSTSGVVVNISRAMRSEYKAGGAKFQTLERVLTMRSADGTETTKTALKDPDLQIVMSGLVGVSRSILQNVILCHQEDSLWPLSESKELKDKFSEIFETSKWTKIGDEIKALRKDSQNSLGVLSSELKRYNSEVVSANLNIEKRKKLEDDIKEMKESMSEISHEASLLSKTLSVFDRIAAIDSEVQNSEKKMEEIRDLYDVVDGAPSELMLMVEKLERKLAEIKDDNVEDGKIADIEKRVEAKRSENGKLAGQKYLLEKSILDCIPAVNGIFHSISNVKDSLGTLYKKGIRNRDHMESVAKSSDSIIVLSDKWKELSQMDTNSFDAAEWSTFEEFVNGICKSAKEISAIFEEILDSLSAVHKTDCAESALAVQKKEDDIREAKLKVERLRATLNFFFNEKKEAFAAKLETLKSELHMSSSHTVNALDKRTSLESFLRSKLERSAVVKGEVLELKNKLSTAQASFSERRASLDEDMSVVKLEIGNMDTLIRRLNESMDSRAVVAQKVKAIADIEASISSIIDEVSDMCQANKDLKGRSSFESSMGVILTAVQNVKDKGMSISSLLDVVDECRTQVQKEASAVTSAKQDAIIRLTTSRAEQSKLSEDLKSYTEKAEEYRSLAEAAIRDVSLAGDTRNIGLDNIGDLVSAIDTQRTSASSEYERLKNLKITYEHFIEQFKATGCCPLCTRGFNNLVDEGKGFLQQLVAQIESVPSELDNASNVLGNADKATKNVLNAQKYYEQYQSLIQTTIPEANLKLLMSKGHIEKLEAEVNTVKSEFDICVRVEKTLNDLLAPLRVAKEKDDELHKLTKFVNDVQKSIDTIGDTRSMEELSNSRQKLYEKKEQLQASSQQLDNEQNSLAELHRKKMDELVVAEDEVSGARALLTEFELEEAEKNHDLLKCAALEFAAENKKCIDEIEESINLVSSVLRPISEKVDIITSKLSGSPAAKIGEVVASMKSNSEFILEDERSMEALRMQQRGGDMEAQRVEHRKLVIEQSLRYRELETEKERLRDQALELQSEVVGRNRSSVETEVLRCRTRYDELQGQITAKNEIRRSLEEEYNSRWQTAAADRRSALINFSTQELLNADLETYAKAIDNSINKFHSMIMNDVNATMDDLWQRTYRGNDIETIKIVADAEKSSARYNYRVVMVKNGTEIDMRGRCSAGQKVLACLIVRLALAERFALKCGFLALDEPTTNLDEDNISSLAAALCDIISSRQKSRFQLLIITHDEHFKEMLMREGLISSYYRITKDHNGMSQVSLSS